MLAEKGGFPVQALSKQERNQGLNGPFSAFGPHGRRNGCAGVRFALPKSLFAIF